jgi:hypothetical protein
MHSNVRFRAPAWRGPRLSFALVIVLAMVALLSIILITFLVVMGNERAASFSYSQSVKVDDVAQGGANLAIQYLRQEIMDPTRSTATLDPSGSGAVTYMPIANAYAVPERMAVGAIDSSLTNLVKISSATIPFYVGTTIPLAASSSSGQASINGRLLTQSRWNRPQLIDSAALSKLVLPDWIVITRSGTTNAWNNALKDQTSANAAIGRVAFAVYDEGGLLDVNSAGYVSTFTNSIPIPLRQKGLLPFADLTQIPGITNTAMTNNFVQWRNPASASSASSYTNYVYNYGATNGFLKVAAGDQAFVSRQDLIQYAQANPSMIGTNALPYLTTFTREMNSPAYSPATPSGSTINYASLANSSGATNINFAAFRDANGQSLKRFSLSRIGLLNYSTPAAASTANAANILTYFGLSLDADGYSWDYQYPADPTKGGIMTLSAVVAAGREPNFFELLQAAILNGSLGLSNWQGIYTIFQASNYYDASKSRQIFAIGANIIDQYRSQSTLPTIINIPSDPTKTPVAGTENLPYITQMITTIYRPTPQEGNDIYRSTVTVHMSFEVWNPNQNASTVPSNGPSNFRIVVSDGELRTEVLNTYPTYVSYQSPVDVNYTTAYSTTTPYQIQFQNQAAFNEPTVLTRANSSNMDPVNGVFNGGSNTSFSGIFMGECLAPEARMNISGNPTTDNWDYLVLLAENPLTLTPPSGGSYQNYGMTIEAQFLDSQGNWQTYQRFPYGIVPNKYPQYSFQSSQTAFPNYYWELLNLDLAAGAYVRPDPRGSRWAAASMAASPTLWYAPLTTTGQSVRPDAGVGTLINGGGLCGPNLATPNFWPPGENTFNSASQMSYIGMVSDNDPSTQATAASTRVSGYSDLDNVIRHADGNTAQNVLPLIKGNAQYRPLILNRPFRSVAELGYAYRDIPWKTIDFSRGESADAGLLDVFTANDDVETVPSSVPSVVAGKVNLNTRRPEVLAALLSGAGVQEYGTLNLSSTSALQIANDIVTATTAKPFLTKADLVSNFGAAQEATFNLPASSAYPAYSPTKTEREAMMRALADAGQARTWNLLIDVVAQVGKYPPSATGFNQFNVEGERRYWLHVAIDRYTGKILDAHLEPVYE